ncbi:hypothetical protein GUITHDRAFT_117251 [Guillardia theta CCMP2712]|uniref:Uncharacterized protein n=2 Tax=Guillardia theta TaxID=55529 RepID=L1IL02_GUITC|nr:hypothetical protein GUITHDRAFT_117249 [Guillardia theta CCMP2712]XP_005823576.1 hypothetical protein GUITHDRAFT_117251 [Guillardia theta CCMP2712]EKX36594.1 hypothetical protein GUITHDRAFT_117249 [Guillardia theta CCMP2712]EKX36596.1 hypothetical protein GUITHDRAFT_117251 [Guillardia theta CCMP2712]|eukprot:XP_005823574.1 hypothetical protein GUITHDRAFT_117249 [Guillardia theta CCMP2712]
MTTARALETKSIHFLALHPLLGYQPVDLHIPVSYSPEEEKACFARPSRVDQRSLSSCDRNMIRAAAWVLCMNVASTILVGAMGVAMGMIH